MRDPKKRITKEELNSCLRMTSSSWRFQNAGINSLKDLIMRSPDRLLRLSGITRKGLNRELQAIARMYPTILEDVPEMNKEIAEMISQLIPDEYKNKNEESQDDLGTKFGTDEEKMGEVIEKIAGTNNNEPETSESAECEPKNVTEESSNNEEYFTYPLKEIFDPELFNTGHIYQIKYATDNSFAFGILEKAEPESLTFTMIRKDLSIPHPMVREFFTPADISEKKIAIDKCNLNPYIALYNTVITGYGDPRVDFTFTYNKNKMLFNNIFNPEDKKNYYRTLTKIKIVGTKSNEANLCNKKETEIMETVLNKTMRLVEWSPSKIVVTDICGDNKMKITPEMLYNYTIFSNIEIKMTRFDKDFKSDNFVTLINKDTGKETEIITGIPVSISCHDRDIYNAIICEIWENRAGFDVILENGKKETIPCVMLPSVDNVDDSACIKANAVIYNKADKTYSVCEFVSKKKNM